MENNKTMIEELSQQIAEQVAKNILCNHAYGMLESVQGDYPLHLDNCTGNAQEANAMEGELAMVKHRMRICIGYNDDGSSIIKQISGNSEQDLADKIVRSMLVSERRAEFVTDAPSSEAQHAPTFKVYTEDWLNTYKSTKLKPTTRKGYDAMLRSHLYPAWENTPIQEIDTKAIQEFLNERRNLSAKYLRDMRILLSQILESAFRDGLIPANHANDSRISIPSTKKTEREALMQEELNDVISQLDMLDEQRQRYLALAIFTGMRRGEILGLRWEDVDLQNNMIHVRRNVTFTNNQPIIGTPKTKSGYRSVPIMDCLLKYLLPLKEKGYIIGNDEQPLTLTGFKNMYKGISKKVNLHKATTHSFRHTLGTMMFNTGADIKTIQGVLGQKDFKTTADRYVHPVEKSKKEAIFRVNDMLFNPAS